MPRISATFRNTTEKLVKAYAKHNGIKFSNAVDVLALTASLEWFGKFTKKEQKEINEEFEIFKINQVVKP